MEYVKYGGLIFLWDNVVDEIKGLLASIEYKLSITLGTSKG
tara:strand:- start:316 stop:438 length:123 start_codon:yes stop_codon:yes gene_type:complete